MLTCVRPLARRRWRRWLPALLGVVVVASGCGAATAAGGPSSVTADVATGANVAQGGGGFRLIVEPRQGMGPIYRILAGATRSLDLTMYELADPTAESILAQDVARGVAVRVILDANRERASNQTAFTYLRSHGVDVVWAWSRYEATHEKAAVIDAGRPDQCLLVMTLNLTARYEATTRDVAVVDRNAADVVAAERVFDADAAHRPVTPADGADLVWSPGSAPALVALIDSARTGLAVENEEMSSRTIVDALVAAARRGVDVQIVMTADDEWDPELAELRAAGAHVHLYPDTARALYIHAKIVVADGRRAFVGSENFSTASLDRNRELGLLVTAPSVVRSLASLVARDAADAPA